jgi:hypothetical protein
MQKLDEAGSPQDERVVVLNPAGMWSMANALSNWNFAEVGKDPAKKGKLGQIAGCTVYMDQNVKAHTVGAWATSGFTDVATTARLIIDATADSADAGGLPTGIEPGTKNNQRILVDGFRNTTRAGLLIGDTFTIASVYGVNPMSGESLSTLRRFVVTADASIASTKVSEQVDVYFYPDLINTGPYKTVDTTPVAGAVVTVDEMPKSISAQNLAFHKNAFALVMVPLEKPASEWSAVETEDGISIRVVKQYNIETDVEAIRLDILYGVKTIYPELACRISGASDKAGYNGARDR